MGVGSGDRLARGARSAAFFTSNSDGEVELKNVSSEPREDFTPVEIKAQQRVKRVIPLYDHILVKRAETELMSAGGILLSSDNKPRPMEGTVVAAGIGRLVNNEVVPLQVTVGDRILFGKYAGTEVNINGEDVLMMREEECLAILEVTD